MFEIDQYRTNYPPELFDPKSLHESDFYDAVKKNRDQCVSFGQPARRRLTPGS